MSPVLSLNYLLTYCGIAIFFRNQEKHRHGSARADATSTGKNRLRDGQAPVRERFSRPRERLPSLIRVSSDLDLPTIQFLNFFWFCSMISIITPNNKICLNPTHCLVCHPQTLDRITPEVNLLNKSPL